jgi:hypothetical protein
MADLLKDYVRLPDLASAVPESYELLRQRANEDRLAVERKGGRFFVDRSFALRLAEHREALSSFHCALQTTTVMQSDSNTENSVSTSVPTLSKEWGIAEHRIRDAASNLSDVALFADKVETTESGLVSLRKRLANQFS